MPPPGPPGGGAASAATAMRLLREWRDNLVRGGQLARGALKDGDLNNAVNFGRRDERLVANVLPAEYRRYAALIVELIMKADREESARDRPAEAGSGPAELPPSSHVDQGTASGSDVGGPGRQPDSETIAGLDALATRFAPYDFSEDPGEPERLRVATASGLLRLEWNPVDLGAISTESGGVSLYRLVLTPGTEPGYGPEFGELLAITERPAFGEGGTGQGTGGDGRTVLDRVGQENAVCWLQVWSNTGATVADAVGSQPRLHAEAPLVLPVRDAGVFEDGGRVIGRWETAPGVDRVTVYRIPVERASSTRGPDPAFQIATDSRNLSGFVDRSAERGRRYLYRWYVEATVGGASQLSAPTGQVVAVSALLEPVRDLHGEHREVVDADGTTIGHRFDLLWSAPPTGRVRIYRTERSPGAGLDAETLDESALATTGLDDDHLLKHPTDIDPDGRTVLVDVPIPGGWERVYFTPVTSFEQRVRVGRTLPMVVIPPVQDPVIVERVDHQLLKFGWPGRSSAVALMVGTRGTAAQLPEDGPGYLEVSYDAYQRLGGLTWPDRLSSDGCSVHLAGLSFVAGQPVLGPPTVVDYPGLARFFYRLHSRRGFRLGVDRVVIELTSEREITSCPPFVLVHNPDRLPLSIGDGSPLPVSLDVDNAGQPKPQFTPERLGQAPVSYRAAIRGLAGFVRLFVDIAPEHLTRVALLDPPVSFLRVGR